MVQPSGRLEGVNWSIERGLVDPHTALTAAQEILDAIAVREPIIAFDHEVPTVGLVGYTVDWESITQKQKVSPSFRFAALLAVRGALARVKGSDSGEEEQNLYNMGYVNITRPGGRVHVHTDSEASSLVFVSLRGKSLAKIKHVSELEYTEGILTPGDVLRVDNPQAVRQRPRHAIYNISADVRVSYGEYYNQ